VESQPGTNDRAEKTSKRCGSVLTSQMSTGSLLLGT
jgi:hypothetical protein